MARRIITEADIVEAAKAGKTTLEAPEGECIVTDQARDRALELGVTLACEGSASCPPQGCPPGGGGLSGREDTGAGRLATQVFEALRARLPQGVDAARAERLVREAVAARMAGAGPTGSKPEMDDSRGDGGFTFVKASAVLKPLGQGTGPRDGALLAEALAAAGQARLSAGYLAWEKASFSRSVDEPEVCVVIEGELHLTVGGRTVVAKPGDLAYLPQGTKAVYSAPGRVVMACVNTRC